MEQEDSEGAERGRRGRLNLRQDVPRARPIPVRRQWRTRRVPQKRYEARGGWFPADLVPTFLQHRERTAQAFNETIVHCRDGTGRTACRNLKNSRTFALPFRNTPMCTAENGRPIRGLPRERAESSFGPRTGT